MIHRKRVLAVASKGGHWEQMLIISKAFENMDVFYISTDESLKGLISYNKFRSVSDCSREKPLKILVSALDIFKVIFEFKPQIVISTGAAPGLIALFLGKILGKKTIWIDSIANSERLSLSGRMALKFCDHTYTQWEHLQSNKVKYQGSVI